MKFNLIFVLIILTSNVFAFSALEQQKAARRSNVFFKFIAESKGLRNFALHQLIKLRCENYLNSNEAYFCSQAVKKQLSILDFDIVVVDDEIKNAHKSVMWTPSSFVFLAFKANFFKLLNDPKTTDYLTYLESELNKFVSQNGEEVNIWDLTLKFYPNKKEASQVIATLFQDISAFKLHLAYLQVKGLKGSESFQSNKLLLSRVIDGINQILDMNEDFFKRLFYPQEIFESMNRNIYHFYVPFYLSLELKSDDEFKAYSKIAPLMLTLTYEFITLRKDSTYFFQDPEKLTQDHFRGTIQDIYGSYRGIAFAQNYVEPLNIGVVTDLFQESTYKTVRALLKTR